MGKIKTIEPRKMKRLFLITFLLLFVFFIYAFILPRRYVVEKEIEPEFGISFSHRHATNLGLNWQEAYQALLDELQPKSVRLPVYWEEVEKEPSQFDFEIVDWQIREAEKRGIPVILAIGYRSFHRPECYPPDWLDDSNTEEFERALLNFLKEATIHFSQFDNIKAWQVENEPLDVFRAWCQKLKAPFVAKEIEAVRANDPQNRPILLTFGGEIFIRPIWRSLVPKIDIIGISFYPKVWHDWAHGYIETYKLGIFSPRNIAVERGEAMHLDKRFWIVEFQAEPWGPKPITELSQKEAKETASPTWLENYFEIVKKAGGIERIYFWGVEWWYKELLEDRPEMWEKGKEIINKQQW